MVESNQGDTYTLRKSTRANKKYMLVAPNGTSTHFGAAGMDDYILKGNDEQKARYLKRHQKEADRWVMKKENLMTPAFLARYILWNRPTLYASVDYIKQHLGVKIKLELH